LKPWFDVVKAEEMGPKIESIGENIEENSFELLFIDDLGNAQTFSAFLQ